MIPENQLRASCVGKVGSGLVISLVRRLRPWLVVLAVAVAACGLDDGGELATGPEEAPPILVLQGTKKLDPGVVCATPEFDPAWSSTNPYFPLDAGVQSILEGEEDDEEITSRNTVLDRTREILGVRTVVLEEREYVDGELAEISWNYFAEARDGTVCYFGEDVDIFEDGEILHEGVWCAEDPGNGPGIFMPGDPQPGMRFPTEVAPGVAEDEAKIVGSGPVTVPFGSFANTLRLREFNPLDVEKEYKTFAHSFGVVIDGPLELTNFTAAGDPVPESELSLQNCGT